MYVHHSTASPLDAEHMSRFCPATAPNFITEIFFITMAMNHYGYQKTLSSFEELAKHLEDMTRHREQLEGDGSWQQVFTAAVFSAMCS